MRNALAFTIEPIVRVIVNLAKQLMFYVGAVIKALTGKDIFANANKSLKSANKQASKLNKTLAGFDEMNILNDNSGGGGGGTTMPSFDLTQNPLGNLNFDALVEKGKEMAIKLAEGINGFFESFDFKGLAEGISKTLRGLIQTITTFISTIDWKQVGEKIAEFVLNIDWLGLLTDIVKLWISGRTAIYDLLGGLIDGIVNFIADTFSSEESSTQFFEAGAELLASLFEAMVTAPLKVLEIIADMVDAFMDPANEDKWFDIGVNIMMGLGNGMVSLIYKIGEVIQRIIDRVKKIFGINSPSTIFYDMGVNLMLGLINGIKSLITTIVGLFSTLWEKIKKVFSSVGSFFGGVWNTIKSKFVTISTSIGDAVGGAFKKVINAVLSAVEKTLNTPINAINKLVDKIRSIPGLSNISKLNTITLPRLAKGGIINMPNVGVPLGSAIGGESGKEGVIPLTDSQQMALLGEAIGRYITINANITNTMNGRVISRELQKINNENDFAYNR